MGALQERITTTNKGSITSVQADLRPRRRLDRPRARHLVRPLGRNDHAEPRDFGKGHLPGCRSTRLDLAYSWTRASSVKITTASPAKCSASSRNTSRCRTSSQFWAWTNSQKTTKSSSARARKIERFLSQPFTSPKSSRTRLASSSTSPTRSKASTGLCRGDYDHLPEQAFLMVGTIGRRGEEGRTPRGGSGVVSWRSCTSISSPPSACSSRPTSTKSTSRLRG